MRSFHVAPFAPLVVALTMTLACRPGIDIEAERSTLLAIDKQWAEVATAGSDLEGIVGYWTDDAKVYPPGMPLVEGKAAIREFVSASMRIPGFSVTWEPQEAVVSPDGRFGYTTGTNRFTVPEPEGRLVSTSGRYVTVWRKEPDGAWRCVLDVWNGGPTP